MTLLQKKRNCREAISIAGTFAILAANQLSGAVIIEETFDYTLGASPPSTAAVNAVVVDGAGTIGSGNALQLTDLGTSGATAEKVSYFETNIATDDANEFEAISFKFDIYNNETPTATTSSFIFGLGGYDASTSPLLNSTATRFFNLEFSSSTDSLTVRTNSEGNLGSTSYNLGASNSIAVFINDNDTLSINYTRPDNSVVDSLSANSFALYVNDTLFEVNLMDTTIASGDSGLGRFSFYSGSSVVSQFTIDNIQIDDLTSVPEPSTYSLLASLVAFGFFLAGRRKQV